MLYEQNTQINNERGFNPGYAHDVLPQTFHEPGVITQYESVF